MPFLPVPSQNPVHISVLLKGDATIGDPVFRKFDNPSDPCVPDNTTTIKAATHEFIGVVASEPVLAAGRRYNQCKHVTVTVQGIVSMPHPVSDTSSNLQPGAEYKSASDDIAIGRIVTKLANGYGVMLNCGRKPGWKKGKGELAAFMA